MSTVSVRAVAMVLALGWLTGCSTRRDAPGSFFWSRYYWKELGVVLLARNDLTPFAIPSILSGTYASPMWAAGPVVVPLFLYDREPFGPFDIRLYRLEISLMPITDRHRPLEWWAKRNHLEGVPTTMDVWPYDDGKRDKLIELYNGCIFMDRHEWPDVRSVTVCGLPGLHLADDFRGNPDAGYFREIVLVPRGPDQVLMFQACHRRTSDRQLRLQREIFRQWVDRVRLEDRVDSMTLDSLPALPNTPVR